MIAGKIRNATVRRGNRRLAWRSKVALGLLWLLIWTCVPAELSLARDLTGDPSQDTGQDKIDPQQVINQAAENGRKAVAAMAGYSYTAELAVRYLGVGDIVEWEYNRSAKVFRDRYGAPAERVIEVKSTLPKDESINLVTVNNLVQIYKFMLTPETLRTYDFNFVGRERIDELETIVFDVKPKKKIQMEPAGQRYLRGRIWIDDQDLQVVKVGGEILPEPRPHRTPRFETYFQNYNNYWLPAYTTAEDDLLLAGDLLRVNVKARFIDYAPNKAF